MRIAAVTRHALDHDVFQTARALHARAHAFSQFSESDVLTPGVSGGITTPPTASVLDRIVGGMASTHRSFLPLHVHLRTHGRRLIFAPRLPCTGNFSLLNGCSQRGSFDCRFFEA